MIVHWNGHKYYIYLTAEKYLEIEEHNSAYNDTIYKCIQCKVDGTKKEIIRHIEECHKNSLRLIE
ncbi:MAG: hypothetical protein RE471_02890 [Ferroplasma sp.]|uniref:hypothetical protein n=1 Tax=Ferroplasma sp. TaxID=2591003 RepID=UPI00281695CB|nr:hypothetical protein [Ferroplasma sp.]WMT51833.1 MAG: hypothetical protein RE471_02890 [Ferroplasma sp.]